MRRCFAIYIAVLYLLPTARGQDNPRNVVLPDSVTRITTLEQNWSDDESAWFYHAAQGSRLIPYRWFLHLEQHDSNKPFLAPAHLLALGYIPRAKSTDNPDGLPIGFAKDAAYEDGTPAVGVTCAACHTSMIEFGNTAYLIDGGPTLGDMETLMKRLVQALVASRDEPAKFDRFAASILTTPTDSEKTKLREKLTEVIEERRGYNERNFPTADAKRFGHGRIDAFGAILNEVAVTFLDLPENHQDADAPVSYPFLWDAPQHGVVQWNGGASNTVSRLGKLLVGTSEMGALGRNAGEVLGVFGHAEINDSKLQFQRYPSTVNKENLVAIEDSLKTLWSPQWPAEFGAIDPEKKARGEQIYRQRCAGCHTKIERDVPDRVPGEKMRAVGTDGKLWENLSRTVKTGPLQGRIIRIKDLLTALKKGTSPTDSRLRFGAESPVPIVLSHVVERSILNSYTDEELNAFAKRRQRLINGLQTGYRAVAFIKGIETEEVAAVPYEAIESVNDKQIFKLDTSLSKRAKRQLSELLGTNAEEIETPAAAYKARPLNGIWATAPYLHNGSVPTLADLLKPSSERPKRFHVGSRKFDPIKVGFEDDDSFPVFDTEQDGNRNQGHEFAAGLDESQRQDLLEYLKSL